MRHEKTQNAFTFTVDQINPCLIYFFFKSKKNGSVYGTVSIAVRNLNCLFLGHSAEQLFMCCKNVSHMGFNMT